MKREIPFYPLYNQLLSPGSCLSDLLMDLRLYERIAFNIQFSVIKPPKSLIAANV